MPIIAFGDFFSLKDGEKNERIPQSATSELSILPESKLFNCKVVIVQRENHYYSHHWSKYENYSCVRYHSLYLGALWGALTGFV